LLAQLRDCAAQLCDPLGRRAWRSELTLLPKVLRHGLPSAVLGRVGKNVNWVQGLDKQARLRPNAPALIDNGSPVTWRELAVEAEFRAVQLRGAGLTFGSTALLLLAPGRTFIATLLGCSRLGVTAGLANPFLPPEWIEQAIDDLAPDLLVVGLESREQLSSRAAVPSLAMESFDPRSWESLTERCPTAATPGRSPCCYLYSSGTTGRSRACVVSHGRVVLAGNAFGGFVLGLEPHDRVYCPIPLYHATGLLVALASCLMRGATLVLPERFSASRFWSDVIQYDATVVVYAGELWRRVLSATSPQKIPQHRLRIAVGNGMGAQTWNSVETRFGIPRIVEFYGATEAPGAMFNFSGLAGAMGRVPLRRLSPWLVVRHDPESGGLVRDVSGRCVPCRPNQVGELLLRLPKQRRFAMGEFEGYRRPRQIEERLVNDIRIPGDLYLRLGDLVVYDQNDYFYFLDRADDVIRQAGENVSAHRIAEHLESRLQMLELAVTAIRVGNLDGRYGLLVVVPDERFSLEALAGALLELPRHARPRFLRLAEGLPRTSSQKVRTAQLRLEGIDPSAVKDPAYFLTESGYLRLDADTWSAIVQEKIPI